MITNEMLATLSNEALVKIYKNRDELMLTQKEKNIIFERILDQNMGAIVKVVNSYNPSQNIYDDLLQAGRMGINRAIQRYDINGDVLFITYAFSQIKSAVADEYNKNISGDATSHYASNMRTIKAVINEIKAIKGENYYPTEEEIRDYIKIKDHKDMPITTIKRSLTAIRQAEHASLDDEEAKIKVAAPDTVVIDDYIFNSKVKTDIDKAFTHLTKTARYVVKNILGYPDGKCKTYEQVAQKMNKIPYFVEQNKGKAFSPFIVEKVYSLAISDLQKDPALQVYDEKSPVFESVVNNASLNLFSAEQHIEVADEIAEYINLSDLPDSF